MTDTKMKKAMRDAVRALSNWSPVHWGSHKIGSIEHHMRCHLSRREVNRWHLAFKLFERKVMKSQKVKPFGFYGLAIYELLLNTARRHRGRVVLSHQQIANMIGISRCTVTRTIDKLNEHGFLDWAKRYRDRDAAVDGPGPKHIQITSCYMVKCPIWALALLGTVSMVEDAEIVPEPLPTAEVSAAGIKDTKLQSIFDDMISARKQRE